MKIQRIVNPIAYENTYLIENDQHLLVIDPGSAWSQIQNRIDQIAKPVSAILLTHTHYDHILSLERVREAYGHPPVYVDAHEADWLQSPIDNLSGLDRHSDLLNVICQPAEQHFDYQQEYNLDNFHFYVLHTPGHSIGGVSIVFPHDHFVLTGDALFRETIGRTDLPTGSGPQLLESIETQLLTLPSSYTVYPGHGNDTTIGHEKMFNPFFRNR